MWRCYRYFNGHCVKTFLLTCDISAIFKTLDFLILEQKPTFTCFNAFLQYFIFPIKALCIFCSVFFFLPFTKLLFNYSHFAVSF